MNCKSSKFAVYPCRYGECHVLVHGRTQMLPPCYKPNSGNTRFHLFCICDIFTPTQNVFKDEAKEDKEAKVEGVMGRELLPSKWVSPELLQTVRVLTSPSPTSLLLTISINQLIIFHHKYLISLLVMLLIKKLGHLQSLFWFSIQSTRTSPLF